MSKPRVRLMKIGDCDNGQRAWQWKSLRPITIITINKRKGEAVYHIGHEFNIDVTRLRVPAWVNVWAIVG